MKSKARKRHRHRWARDRKCWACSSRHWYCRDCGMFRAKKAGFTWAFGKFYKDGA